MSAPLVWIILPIIVAGSSFFFQRWQKVITITLTLFTLLLALMAWLLPIGELIVVGPWTFTILDRLVFAGRQFVLGNADRSILIIIYFSLSFFFAGSFSAGVSKLFAPLGLAMSAMLIASLAVEPFLYAALFIQVSVLISIPILSPPGNQIERGVLRYLAMMSMGLPFMLVGGWLLSNVDLTATNPAVLYPVLIPLGLGFAFLLAIFPLNSWIPMLTERIDPYSVTFVLSILPLIVITLLLRFTNQYPWLLDFDVIQFLGVLMVLTGGIWVVFQRDLGRMLGYAVILEIGRTILAISQPDGLSVYIVMFLPRIFAFALWAISLSIIRKQVGDLSFRSIQGYGRQLPLSVLGVVVAQFSLAGFPLLAGFPVLLLLLDQLVQSSPIVAVFTLIGSFGLLVAGLRSLAVLVMGPDKFDEEPKSITSIAQIILLFGIALIFLVGIFPHWYTAVFINLVELGLG